MAVQLAIPPDIRMGEGALEQLSDVLARLDCSRPLVITDGFLAGNGVADRVLAILAAQHLSGAIFSNTVPDPTTNSLGAGLDAVREHQADALIALGGGSPIDTAKALAVLSVRGGELREIKAPFDYAGPALPIIAIPTTAGTGSEATKFTVVTDSETGEKMLCIGASYLPKAAIVDSALTLSMPSRLTADTGIDALTHAVEAFVSHRANPLSDALALAAIETIGGNLRRVFHDGEDREARASMMAAATLAGIAFSNSSVALVHGMSRPLGAHFGVAHGMANAMLFADVTEFSLGVADHRYAECARALGVAERGTSDDVAARALVAELHALAQELEVPTPQSFGVSESDWQRSIPIMAEQALASGSPANNPRVPNQEEIEGIYRLVYAK